MNTRYSSNNNGRYGGKCDVYVRTVEPRNDAGFYLFAVLLVVALVAVVACWVVVF